MKIAPLLGALAFATAFAAGCRDNRVLGTERNSAGASMTRPVGAYPPTPATATIVRAPDATNEEDTPSIPELSEPIWTTEASGASDVPSNEAGAEPGREECSASPGGQERQEALEARPR